MTDQEIVGALVEAGILECQDGSDCVIVVAADTDWKSIKTVLADWRVAGACLERMDEQDLFNALVALDVDGVAQAFNDVLLRDPRAICEAFAVSEGQPSD